MAWHARICTLFPEAFPGPLKLSLAGKALERGIWSYDLFDIRDFATDKHRQVDDTPFGGGAGMVMRPDVAAAALKAASEGVDSDTPKIYFSPRGKPLTQSFVRELASKPQVILLCGRYEGLDQRIIDAENLTEVSIGDYILSGGEMAALVLIDAVVRLLPEVMGNEASNTDESFEHGLLEHPLYTQPREWEGKAVPEVLTSGNHEAIKEWRQQQAEAITKKRRPDLWAAWQANRKK